MLCFTTLVTGIDTPVAAHIHNALAGRNGPKLVSALCGVVLLADSFPGKPKLQLHALVRRHVEQAVTQEWPDMAQQKATLTVTSVPLAMALRLALSPWILKMRGKRPLWT
jgi:hypothetical protein